MNQEHEIDRDLFRKITKPDIDELLEEEAKFGGLVVYLKKLCSDIEEEILETRERDKTNTTDETGANFLLGEEDDVIAP